MTISKEQEQKAKDQFFEDIKDVDENDVEYASKKGNKKLEKVKITYNEIIVQWFESWIFKSPVSVNLLWHIRLG